MDTSKIPILFVAIAFLYFSPIPDILAVFFLRARNGYLQCKLSRLLKVRDQLLKEKSMETKAFKALNADNELPGQSELSQNGFVIFPDYEPEEKED